MQLHRSSPSQGPAADREASAFRGAVGQCQPIGSNEFVLTVGEHFLALLKVRLKLAIGRFEFCPREELVVIKYRLVGHVTVNEFAQPRFTSIARSGALDALACRPREEEARVSFPGPRLQGDVTKTGARYFVALAYEQACNWFTRQCSLHDMVGALAR